MAYNGKLYATLTVGYFVSLHFDCLSIEGELFRHPCILHSEGNGYKMVISYSMLIL